MVGIHILDEKERNDVWLVLEQVTAATDISEETLQGLEIHLAGGTKIFLNKWTTKRWVEFFDKTVRQISLASAGGMRAQ